MGSPISVVIAEMTMQYIESKIFENCPIPILFWKRYVDDVLAIIPADKVNEMLDHINSIDPAI